MRLRCSCRHAWALTFLPSWHSHLDEAFAPRQHQLISAGLGVQALRRQRQAGGRALCRLAPLAHVQPAACMQRRTGRRRRQGSPRCRPPQQSRLPCPCAAGSGRCACARRTRLRAGGQRSARLHASPVPAAATTWQSTERGRQAWCMQHSCSRQDSSSGCCRAGRLLRGRPPQRTVQQQPLALEGCGEVGAQRQQAAVHAREQRGGAQRVGGKGQPGLRGGVAGGWVCARKGRQGRSLAAIGAKRNPGSPGGGSPAAAAALALRTENDRMPCGWKQKTRGRPPASSAVLCRRAGKWAARWRQSAARRSGAGQSPWRGASPPLGLNT